MKTPVKNTHTQENSLSWLVYLMALFVGAITCVFVGWANVPNGDLRWLKILHHAPVPTGGALLRHVSPLAEPVPLSKPSISAESLNATLRKAVEDGDVERVKRCLVRMMFPPPSLWLTSMDMLTSPNCSKATEPENYPRSKRQKSTRREPLIETLSPSRFCHARHRWLCPCPLLVGEGRTTTVRPQSRPHRGVEEE